MVSVSLLLLLLLYVFSFMCLCSFITSQPLLLPKLPYDYNALEPVMSEETLRAHHLHHHQAYTDKVNLVLIELREQSTESKQLAKRGLDWILTQVIHNSSLHISAQQRASLRNNGGGYVNHELFFGGLHPPTGEAEPPAHLPLLVSIQKQFSSFALFQSEFMSAGLSVFGSGWVWLVGDGIHGLSIVTTSNQDNPRMNPDQQHLPLLLCVDVWEHAYYIQHKWDRAQYLRDIWALINWTTADAYYQAANKQHLHTEL